MGNAIMLAFGKAKKDKGGADDAPPDDAGSDEDVGASKDEVRAYTELKAALNGGDDETGAMALKNFIQICKGY